MNAKLSAFTSMSRRTSLWSWVQLIDICIQMIINVHFVGGTYHSDNNSFHVLSPSLNNLSTVSFAHGQYAMETWWLMYVSMVGCAILEVVKWAPLSDTNHSAEPKADINFGRLFVATLLSGSLVHTNHVYEARSSLITKHLKYIALPWFYKEVVHMPYLIWLLAIKCSNWWPKYIFSRARHRKLETFCTIPLMFSFLSFPWCFSLITSSVQILPLCPLLPHRPNPIIDILSSIESSGIQILRIIAYAPWAFVTALALDVLPPFCLIISWFLGLSRITDCGTTFSLTAAIFHERLYCLYKLWTILSIGRQKRFLHLLYALWKSQIWVGALPTHPTWIEHRAGSLVLMP